MRTGALVTILVILVVVFILIWGASTNWWQHTSSGLSNTEGVQGVNNFNNQVGNVINSLNLDQKISDGTITVYYPSADFGLATTPQQITVRSYIPPCDSGFNYCVYYTGTKYKGTNFESAGIRVQKRPDLAAEGLCLYTPPMGFASSTTPNGTHSADTYSTSYFRNTGTAGAGHLATSALYRLFVRGALSCYEFETRVGMTNFANFQPGTVREFTVGDENSIVEEVNTVLSSITLANGEKIIFVSP